MIIEIPRSNDNRSNETDSSHLLITLRVIDNARITCTSHLYRIRSTSFVIKSGESVLLCILTRSKSRCSKMQNAKITLHAIFARHFSCTRHETSRTQLRSGNFLTSALPKPVIVIVPPIGWKSLHRVVTEASVAARTVDRINHGRASVIQLRGVRDSRHIALGQ